jgi:hypothetical protein
VDEAHAFVDGCVPNWNKNNTRKKKGLEHELTWAYYRMRRHAHHPERKEVGDPAMPKDCVVEAMRYGTANQFQFWRDLRPPFHVTAIRRDVDEPEAGHHPDGDLFCVTYSCGIDYCGERLWNKKSVNGTFDNMIHGIATMRIPEGFPSRPLIVVSWGRPSLIWSQEEKFDEHGTPIQQDYVDPDKWMPISDELGLRADMSRFAACRASTRKANCHRPVQVAPIQSLLLGPHPSLPRLAATHQKEQARQMSASPVNASDGEAGTPSPIRKKRQHRIYTAAAGFVRYAG